MNGHSAALQQKQIINCLSRSYLCNGETDLGSVRHGSAITTSPIEVSVESTSFRVELQAIPDVRELEGLLHEPSRRSTALGCPATHQSAGQHFSVLVLSRLFSDVSASRRIRYDRFCSFSVRSWPMVLSDVLGWGGYLIAGFMINSSSQKHPRFYHQHLSFPCIIMTTSDIYTVG